ncbi:MULTISPECIES: hypothetical protein [Sphingobacterium]|uniref:Outer membrane protein beta-barrel domain-containing protein n=1 Tax=Sphingobacterium siyangense TaxID=459529 RepID=A0A562M9N5_9SPHI|nr:hypothetical protein [Sphingobacterium siyangense]TWI16636.1 hypothetical protein IQ31_04171 [Sphingobacterium siyangense]
MYRYQRIALLIILLGWSASSFAQTKDDSIPQKVVQYATDKFPSIRAFNIEYNYQAPYQYSSKLRGNKMPDNKVKGLNQLRVNANTTLFTKNSWIFGSTINYRYSSFSSAGTNPFSGNQDNDNDYHYYSVGLNVARVSMLFGKPFIYSGSILGEGSEKNFERLKGVATGTLVLKANAQTKVTVGLVAMIDPTAIIPVLPSFSYEHKFKNGWMADIILPQRVYMRKGMLKNGRFSIGSELDGTTFYLYDLYGDSQRFQYQQIEINSGMMYEHNFGASFIGTIKSGIKSIPTGRVFEKNENFNNYALDIRPQSSFYLNLGLSFNPFRMK